MMYFIFGIFLTLICRNVNGQDGLPLYAPGTPISNPSDLIGFATPAQSELTCDPTTIGAQCAQDCATFMICTGSNTPSFITKCPAAQPYCVNGGCTSAPDPTNSLCVSQFKCTSVGTFPDPIDCTKYHNCPIPHSPAETYVCPPTYTYISSIKTCKRTTECQKISCPTDRFATVLFTKDPAYYAFCLPKPDGSTEVIMYKCHDEISDIYDIETSSCKFNCKAEGNYVDRSDCHWYVSCYKENGKFQYTSMPCGLGYYFDKLTKLCVPESVPCNSEITTIQPAEVVPPTPTPPVID